jgi:Sec-independent protein secretion pathway components
MSIGIWQIAIVVILVVLLFRGGKISSLMGDVAKGIKV